MPIDLAVLERRWEDRGNYGVRPIFELIAAVTGYDPHGYRHDMFLDASSFRGGLSKLSRTKRSEAVYVASHGDRAGLTEHRGRENRVELADIVATLKDENRDGNIRGMYFGVCSFAHATNIEELLCPSNDTNLKWVAGYSKDIPWLESAAADMLFWSGYLHSTAEPIRRASQGVKNIRRYMPTLDQVAGFGVFKWSHRNQRVESLLSLA